MENLWLFFQCNGYGWCALCLQIVAIAAMKVMKESRGVLQPTSASIEEKKPEALSPSQQPELDSLIKVIWLDCNALTPLAASL